MCSPSYPRTKVSISIASPCFTVRRVRSNPAIVASYVARYGAGFANAEGGVLILGIEDDHTITGHQLPPKALESLLAVTQARLQPPLPGGFLITHGNYELVVFDVPSADAPVASVGRKPCSTRSPIATTAFRAPASKCGCSTTAWK